MGLGAGLLMEKCGNGLDELFTPGENILPVYTRNDAAQAARIAAIFLERPAALEEIAKNGRELVKRNIRKSSALVRYFPLPSLCCRKMPR